MPKEIIATYRQLKCVLHVEDKYICNLKYFYERTDEDHQINTFDLLKCFKEKETPATAVKEFKTMIEAFPKE